MNWMQRAVAMGLLAISMFGCMAVELDPQQQAQQTKVTNTPLTFTVKKEESDAVWGKAQVWITNYAPYKIQTATDYVLQTFNPTEAHNDDYAYSVTREPGDKTDTFTVTCTSPTWIYEDEAVMNGKVFAHYLQTGEMIGWMMTPAR